MRHTLALIVLVVAAVQPGGSTQKEDQGDRPTRKGDALVVKGCLSGASLAATETSATGGAALLSAGLTFRLTGERRLLRQLRDKHDRRIVEVRGILKSDLPQPSAQGRNVGGMRIAIGAPSPNAGRPQAESMRLLPALEVKAFEGGDTFCGR